MSWKILECFTVIVLIFMVLLGLFTMGLLIAAVGDFLGFWVLQGW